MGTWSGHKYNISISRRFGGCGEGSAGGAVVDSYKVQSYLTDRLWDFSYNSFSFCKLLLMICFKIPDFRQFQVNF